MSHPQDALIEGAVTAYRTRDLDGRIEAAPEWWDLAPELLDEVYRRQVVAREMERLLDAEGWSGTMHAVMARIEGGG